MMMTRRGFGLSAGTLAIVSTTPGFVFAQDLPNDGGPPANVFISPPGRPYRAKEDAPYAVADWFKAADKNADGKIDKAEFLADSEAFFTLLDRNKDGVLAPSEIAFYEQRIAPEVLGYRVDVSAAGLIPTPTRPRLWRAQTDRPGPIDPGGDEHQEDTPKQPHSLDESNSGAAPFSFFDEPEPLMAADLHFRGYVMKADFMKLADAHFSNLDRQEQGYLTLATLPETPMQKRLAKIHHRKR